MNHRQLTPRAMLQTEADERPERRDMIVVGGSAGALDAMLAITAGLPAEFTGNLFIVSHIGANPSLLPELLGNAGRLPAKHPQNGEPIRPGTIYVAPPDRHMLLTRGAIQLSRGPRQHFTRPAVDPLFRTAAEAYGPRVIGVVLSGTGSDGAAGLERIKASGGIAVVQDPATALHPEMPRSAIAAIPIDHRVTLEHLPALLRRRASEPAPVGPPPQADEKPKMDEFETPIALTCPECGGALREITGTAVKQYRCHIGHQFGVKEIAAGQSEEIDLAVGVALRVLNERVGLCRDMVESARAGRRDLGVAHWQRLQRDAERQMLILQRFLAQQPPAAADPSAAD